VRKRGKTRVAKPLQSFQPEKKEGEGFCILYRQGRRSSQTYMTGEELDVNVRGREQSKWGKTANSNLIGVEGRNKFYSNPREGERRGNALQGK